MGFLGYLILGSAVYVIGFMINLKILNPKRKAGTNYTLTHPTMIQLLLACFVIMLAVSAMLGRFVMGHESLDLAFILANSMVATFVFYFGLNPDQSQMNLPD
ncbi:Uncharacterised protein [Moraxella lacunata]|uniref:Uncharacterized protein n=1 Tax=Moraxella lacunata TaxID=477 RepID=A0A378T546_MORLA|nr:hypothetical protein [Moraxella lacunata]STZ55514.1 Uncharacterised protein [Moraxella lacunata]